MGRRPARFTEADLARVFAASQARGDGRARRRLPRGGVDRNRQGPEWSSSSEVGWLNMYAAARYLRRGSG